MHHTAPRLLPAASSCSIGSSPTGVSAGASLQVRRYLSDRPTLRLAVLLLDSRREPQRSDLNMIRYFRAADVPLLVLATKVRHIHHHQQQQLAVPLTHHQRPLSLSSIMYDTAPRSRAACMQVDKLKPEEVDTNLDRLQVHTRRHPA